MSIKVVLIISNSSNEISEYLAQELLKLGHKVAKVRRDGDIVRGIKYHCRSIPAESGPLDNYLDLRVDFEDEVQVDRIIPIVISQFGRLDALINNLSYDYQPFSLLDDYSFDEFNGALQIELYIPARLAQLASAHLRLAPEGGVIINIAPGTGRLVPQNMFRDMIKAGLIMLTKALANSFEDQNVRCLGIVSSSDRMTEVAQAEMTSQSDLHSKISELIKFLISEFARMDVPRPRDERAPPMRAPMESGSDIIREKDRWIPNLEIKLKEQ